MKDLFGGELYQPPPTLDAEKAKAARDDGIKRVLDNNDEWSMNALAHIQNVPHGWIGTAEDLRVAIGPQVGQPKHPNAWGGLMNAALRRGWFAATGQWVKPKDVKSHSRPTREYRRI